MKNLSVPQLAEQLGISGKKAWRLVSAREIDVLRVGRRVLITETALSAYIERNTIPAKVA